MSRPVFGIRADARIFLGKLLGAGWARNLGITGSFNTMFAGKYTHEVTQEAFASSMHQWDAGLCYRLAFEEAPLAPTFLFRGGVGSVQSSIAAQAQDMVSAGYLYPFVGLELHLMLARPTVRVFLSASHFFTVALSEDLSGSGLGYRVAAGIEFDLFDALVLGLGYDRMTMFIDEDTMGKTSDTYSGFFLRAGWRF